MSLRSFIKVLSVIWATAISLIMTHAWMLAYLNGNSVVLYINKFGEAQPELVMWYIVWPVMSVGLYYFLEDEHGDDETSE